MKAICLLLCLALAQGHIFKQKRYQNTEKYIVRPDNIVPQTEYQREAYPRSPMVARDGVLIKSWNDFYKSSNEDLETVRNMRVNQKPFISTMQNKDLHAQSAQSSSSEESMRPTQKIREQAIPVYTDDYLTLPTMNTRRIQVQAEIQPAYGAYGDNSYWRGVQISDVPTYGDVVKGEIEKIFSDAYSTMARLSPARKAELHQIYLQAAKNVNEDAQLNATELLNKYQYPVETHTIKTDDGYFLTLFRIQPKDQTLVQKPVVFLMHGLLGSADDWLLMGPGRSLAYLLADAGYEVWLGNARGNKYSRRHVSKHPAQAEFWQFTNDEIALHDLPAMIDYALKTSQQEKMYYVGYSQGTTAFFALTAARPEYNNRIIMMYALSPMVYMSGVRSPLFRMIAPTSPVYERLHHQLGHGEFKPTPELVSTLGGSMCENQIGCKNVCSNVNFVMAGVNMDNLDVERIPVIIAHLPAGGSTRQMKQYAQWVASNEFTRYDYGPMINEQVYGSPQPPSYNMSKVETPVVLYYSEEDWLANPKDVERLVKELPNVADSYKVPELHFSHMDFQFSKNAPQTVYNRLIEDIKQNTQKNWQKSNVY